jgi:hypothetical protein
MANKDWAEPEEYDEPEWMRRKTLQWVEDFNALQEIAKRSVLTVSDIVRALHKGSGGEVDLQDRNGL